MLDQTLAAFKRGNTSVAQLSVSHHLIPTYSNHKNSIGGQRSNIIPAKLTMSRANESSYITTDVNFSAASLVDYWFYPIVFQ